MKYFLHIILLVLIICGGCGAPRQDARSGAKVAKDSTPENGDTDSDQPKGMDAEFDKQLGQYEAIGDYSIRPPAGYVRRDAPGAPNGAGVSVWIGERRDDGTAPMVQVTMVTPPKREELPDLKSATERFIASVRRRRSNWSTSELEIVKIDGRSFAKQTWTGVDLVMKRKMQGIMFVGLFEGELVQLHTQDVEPHFDESLKLGEASILTFK